MDLDISIIWMKILTYTKGNELYTLRQDCVYGTKLFNNVENVLSL